MMMVVPPPFENGGRATALPTAVRPSRARLSDASPLACALSAAPSLVAGPEVPPVRLVPDDPVLADPVLRGTAWADPLPDDDPEGASTGAGVERDPPPEPDPPLEPEPPEPEPPPELEPPPPDVA